MTNKIQIPLELPNIVMELPEDKDPTLHREYRYDLLKEFVYMAAKEFPQWTFVQEFNYGTERTRRTSEGLEYDYYCLDVFGVFDGREELGGICAAFNRNAPCIRLTNLRIHFDSERGSSKETKDLKKAIRLLKKYFGTKTLEELTKDALNEARRSISYAHNEKGGEWLRWYRHMTDNLGDYVMENAEVLVPMAEQNGANSKIRSILDMWEEQKITGGISQCLANENGVVVYLHGQNYAVTKLDGTIRVYTADDAPDTLKRKLGLLKLVEDGQCITDTGMRVNERNYFIAGESF
jgi:hypothetical protein